MSDLMTSYLDELEIDFGLLRKDLLTATDAAEVGRAIVTGLTEDELYACWKMKRDPLQTVIEKREQEVKRMVFTAIEKVDLKHFSAI